MSFPCIKFGNDLVEQDIQKFNENFSCQDFEPSVEKIYNICMAFGRMNPKSFNRSLDFKVGHRTETLFFPKNDEYTIRLIFNYGPDDCFRMSKVISGSNRTFVDMFIPHNGVQVINEDMKDHDIILTGNPMRDHIIRQKAVDMKGKKITIDKKVKRPRRLDHLSKVFVFYVKKLTKESGSVFDYEPDSIEIDSEKISRV